MPTKFKPELSGTDQNGNDFEFPLALVNADATLSRGVSVQEIVDSNGAYLDDFGRTADRYRFRAAFLGSTDLGTNSDIFPTIEDGEDLWTLFREFGGECVFVHPSLGAVPGRVNSISRSENDEVDALFFDFEFIEEGVVPQATVEVDVISETERGFRKTIEDEGLNFGNDILSMFGAEGADLLALDLDPDISIFDQVSSFSKGVRDFAKGVDSSLQTLDGVLTTIENPANSLIAVIDYGTSLPGRVLGSIAKVGERYKELYQTLVDSPSKFATSLSQGLSDLEGVLNGSEVSRSLKAVNSQNLAVGTAESYEIDQSRRLELKKIESQASFDTEGNRLNREEPPGDVESLEQVEESLGVARNSLQGSIDANRDVVSQGGVEGEVQGVKISAEALLFHVQKVKAEIDKIITVEIVTGNMPLHLLMNTEGENFQKAERVLSLNDIKNPTFSEGEVRIYEG